KHCPLESQTTSVSLPLTDTITGNKVVNELGLKIDDISNAEIYDPISKLDVVGGIREIDVSILSKDYK
ncbi:7672_t:CDS:2, partial [Dentiscutata heterogama]